MKRFARYCPLLITLACSVRYVWIATHYSSIAMVGDQWAYQEPTLFYKASLWQIFRFESHPWRQGVGGILELFVGSLDKWNMRVESIVAALFVICACLLALYLKTRIAGKLTYTDAVIPLLVLSVVTHETVVGMSHFSHGPIPIILTFLFALCWTIKRAWIRYLSALVVSFLALHTGFALFVGLIFPLLIFIDAWRNRQDRDRLRIAAFAFVLSLVSLGIFFHGFQSGDGVCPGPFSDPGTGRAASYPNPLHFLLFVAFMLSNVAAIKPQFHLVAAMMVGTGMLIMIAFLAIRYWRASLAPLALILYSGAFALATAKGRMCLGLGAAVGSRYAIYLIPAVIGAYLIAVKNKRKIPVLAILCIALYSGAFIHKVDGDDMEALHSAREQWSECYLRQHDLKGCNRLIGPNPYIYPDNIQGKVDFLEEHNFNIFALPVRYSSLQ